MAVVQPAAQRRLSTPTLVVLVFVLVAAVGWWWWSAPVPGVRLVPIALTSDANPEQGIAIDAAGNVFYVDEGRLVRAGDPPEVLPFEHVELVSTNAAADGLALVIDIRVAGRPLFYTALPGTAPDMSCSASTIAVICRLSTSSSE